MAFSARFGLGLVCHAAALMLAAALLIGAVMTPGLGAARLLAGGLVLASLAALWRYIGRTNREVARFLDAARFGDFSQRFERGGGAGFDEMGAALDHALKGMRDRQAGLAEEVRFLSAAVDDAPVALLAIDADGRVTALGKAARRLFDRPVVTRVADFAAYGAELAAAMALPPGSRRLSRIVLDGVPQQVLVGAARLDRLGRGMTIVSVQPVQRELGRAALVAEADLVRVLTHEIMNSLTPVTSLARSSADLVRAAAGGDAGALADAGAAADTVAARAEGILRFVTTYRDFAASPEVKRRRFAAGPWAQGVVQLGSADPRATTLALAARVMPPDAAIDGDADLLTQVALNLVRNAALAGASRAELRVTALRGGQAAIELADDGPGIPPERRADVFLPFYTTRAEGSGVGLSLARQVALAHGGSIAADQADLGGASIRLVV